MQRRRFRFYAFLGFFFKVGVEQHPHHQQTDAYADADVSEVEDGKVHEQDVDVVDHHAGSDAVDQVADAAAQYQSPGYPLQRGQLAGKQHPQYAQQHQRGMSFDEVADTLELSKEDREFVLSNL